MLGTGYFLKINTQQEKPRCPSAMNAVHGRSSRYHSFKQKQGLFHIFNPHRTIARSHTTWNCDFFESIS